MHCFFATDFLAATVFAGATFFATDFFAGDCFHAYDFCCAATLSVGRI
jgi:hypothetical protein